MSDQSLSASNQAMLTLPSEKPQSEHQNTDEFDVPSNVLRVSVAKGMTFFGGFEGLNETPGSPPFTATAVLAQGRQDLTINHPRFPHGDSRQDLLTELENLEAMAESSKPTDESATLFESGTFEFARRFIEQLPLNTNKPEIDLTLKGEVEFAWEQASGDGLCVLVLPSGNLAMSGIFGEIKLHGTVDWDQMGLPDCVVCGLRWSCV